jgi:hypothetical protein
MNKKSIKFNFTPVSDKTNLPDNLSIVFYDSAEKIFAEHWGGEIETDERFCFELEDGTEDSMSFSEACEHIKESGLWGYVNVRDNTVHIWIDRDTVEIETVLSFFAHELGHLQRPTKRDFMKEEMKAEQYSDIARAAYDLVSSVMQRQ